MHDIVAIADPPENSETRLAMDEVVRALSLHRPNSPGAECNTIEFASQPSGESRPEHEAIIDLSRATSNEQTVPDCTPR